MAAVQHLVANELLCFLSNQLHTIPFDDLVKCTSTFYSVREIVSAKDLLFETAKHPTKRNKKRKASTTSKEVADTTDILELLVDCDAQGISLPTFAIVNMSNVPSIPVNNFDVNTVYKELSRLRDDIQSLQKTVDSKPNMAETSGSLPPAVSNAYAQPAGVSGTLAPSSASHAPPADVFLSSADVSASSAFNPELHRESFAKVLRSPKRKQREFPPRAARSGIIGVATNVKVGDSAKVLKATEQRMSFYVGRFDLGTTVEDIKCYLGASRPEIRLVSVDALPAAEAYGYCAFKVTCLNAIDTSKILDASLWPEGIRCRRFYEGRTLRKATSAAVY